MVKVSKIVAVVILSGVLFGTTGGVYATNSARGSSRPSTGSVEAAEKVEVSMPEIAASKESLVVSIVKAENGVQTVIHEDVSEPGDLKLAEEKAVSAPADDSEKPAITPLDNQEEAVVVPPQESAPTLPPQVESGEPEPVYDHIEPWLEDPEIPVPEPVYDHIEPWIGDPEVIIPAPPLTWPEDEKYLTAEEFAVKLYGTNVLAYVERDYKHTPNNGMKHAGMTLYSDTGSGLPVDIEFLDIENDMPLGCYELVSSKTSECYGDYASNVAYFYDAQNSQLFTVTSTEKGLLFETEVDGEYSAYFADVVPCGTYGVSEVYTCTSEYTSEIGPAICAYAICEKYDIRILNLLHMYWSSDFCMAVK